MGGYLGIGGLRKTNTRRITLYAFEVPGDLGFNGNSCFETHSHSSLALPGSSSSLHDPYPLNTNFYRCTCYLIPQT